MDPTVNRWHEIQNFLFHEANLLDERQWDNWLDLYLENAEYWVPYKWDQQSPTDHVSLFYEDFTLLRMRIDRLKNELSPTETPPSRTNHHITNVTILDDRAESLTAKAYLIFVEYRRNEQRWFSARVTWNLKILEGAIRISAKRVDLLNSDQERGHLWFATPI